MTIRWITPMLGTAAAVTLEHSRGLAVVDVRDLVDKAGNRGEPIRAKIQLALDALASGQRTVICCDYGVSRSNAIAAGVLARCGASSFEAAVRQVQAATGETEIKLEPLRAVRDALGCGSTEPATARTRAVLMTGASGFLGRTILAAKYPELNLTIPGPGRIDLAAGSIELDLAAADSGADCILHLANPRIYTSNVALGMSLTMLRNVLDVCANRDLKLVYAACWEVYSGYSGCLLADEATPRLPRGPYGEAKYLAEMLIEHWMRTRGLRCAMLRSSAVYGEGGDRPKFMHNFFGKILRGEKIVTHHYRTGDARLDLLHVEDFASAVAAALRADFVGVLNIGTGTLTSTFDLAARLSNLQGRSTDIERIDIDADSASIAMNWRRAEAEVGWRPRVTLEQGLQRLFPHVTERPLRS